MTSEPVGFARDLPVQRVMRAVVGETDMVVWRSRAGKLAAWDNRCPHRGMRLSHGFVRGETLACLYHGWHFGSAGGCTYIPAHPDLDPPRTIKTEVYQIREQNGVLWVSDDGDVMAPILAGNLIPVRSLTLDCAQTDAAAAFVDIRASGKAVSLAKGCVSAEAPCIISFDSPDIPDAVIVLLQQNPGQSVTAHILADKTMPAQGLIAVSRWAEAVRRAAERRSDVK